MRENRHAVVLCAVVGLIGLLLTACAGRRAVQRPVDSTAGTAVAQRDADQPARAPIGIEVSQEMRRRYESQGWPTVSYVVTLEHPQTQTVQVTMRIDGAIGETLNVHLPTWRPGKYLILDQAGSIRRMSAADGAGNPLRMVKRSKSHWRVYDGDADTVVVRYELFANDLNDRTRHVDDTHAFLSGESIFVYVPELIDRPLTVRIEAPESWRVSTGLAAGPGADEDHPRVFAAPGYDLLVDSPFEIGTHDRLSFQVEGVPHEIAIWGDARCDADALIRDFRAIVQEQAAIFGSMPYEKYVFILHVTPRTRGGTEHVNSTVMQTMPNTVEGSFDDNPAYRGFLGLVSHEMFHTWNVKSFRPAGLSPYDYQYENYTTLLWLVEGTTSYYDDLTLARSGLIDEKGYRQRLANQYNSYARRPGRHVQSLADASFDSWIKYNQPSADSVNATVSFYRKGALVSFLLDMEIRRATNGRASLDDVMRRLYEQFPRGSGGYTETDLLRVIEQVSGENFDAFFDDYVYGTREIVPDDALAVVGLEAARKADDEDKDDHDSPNGEAGDNASEDESPDVVANLGVTLRGNRVRAAYAGEPASDAGVIAGDEIVAIDNRQFDGNLESALALYEPGDVVNVTLFRRGLLRTMSIELGGRPKAQWSVRRVEDPTDAQRAMYERWLGLPFDPE